MKTYDKRIYEIWKNKWKNEKERVCAECPMDLDSIVLIVDDNPCIRKLFKCVLKNRCNADTAENGQEAIEKLEKKTFKLVISDIDMPIKDGITFYKEAIEKHPDLLGKFLFISGNLSSDRIQFFKSHGIHYLQKPAHMTEIIEKADKILNEQYATPS